MYVQYPRFIMEIAVLWKEVMKFTWTYSTLTKPSLKAKSWYLNIQALESSLRNPYVTWLVKINTIVMIYRAAYIVSVIHTIYKNFDWLTQEGIKPLIHSKGFDQYRTYLSSSWVAVKQRRMSWKPPDSSHLPSHSQRRISINQIGAMTISQQPMAIFQSLNYPS
jgi:hypothetical protein